MAQAIGMSRRTGGALLAAAALAGAALFNLRKARTAERRHPPIGQFVTVDGVRLHYIDRGAGEPVVLLHGNGTMIEDYLTSGLVDRLAQRYRVIAFDRPGFGHSERPRGTVWTPTAQAAIIAHALDEIGVGRATIVGHSLATQVVLALALDHGEHVGALVLLSGYYFPTARTDVPLLAAPAIPILGDAMRYTISPLLGRLIVPALIRKSFAPAPVSEHFLHEFPVEMALRPSQLRAAAAESAMMIPAAMQLGRRYASLTVPTVILAGDGDRIANFGRQSERLHGLIQGSELRRVEGAGHMIHHSAPDSVVAAIDQAMARAVGGGAQSRFHAVAGTA